MNTIVGFVEAIMPDIGGDATKQAARTTWSNRVLRHAAPPQAVQRGAAIDNRADIGEATYALAQLVPRVRECAEGSLTPRRGPREARAVGAHQPRGE
jgi:hypothetical protein